MVSWAPRLRRRWAIRLPISARSLAATVGWVSRSRCSPSRESAAACTGDSAVQLAERGSPSSRPSSPSSEPAPNTATVTASTRPLSPMVIETSPLSSNSMCCVPSSSRNTPAPLG